MNFNLNYSRHKNDYTQNIKFIDYIHRQLFCYRSNLVDMDKIYYWLINLIEMRREDI